MSASPDATAVRHDLRALLAPRSIAIVGVSRDSARQNTINGSAVLGSLARHGYDGTIRLVHPDAGTIDGRPVSPSIEALPEATDLVVIAVASSRVPQTIADCGRRGIRAAVVMSAGFAELGEEEGLRLEREVRAAAAQYGVAICGPNGVGYVNVPANVYAGYFPCVFADKPRAGGLSVVTQSGAVGNSLLARAMDRAIGIGCVISAGNETNVGLADYLDFLVDDPGTRVVSLYLEGVSDGRRLRAAFERAARAGKPVVAYKVGKSKAGAKAALSHTAKVAGEPALYQGLFRQCGVIEATRLDDLIELPMLLLKQRSLDGAPPRGLGVVTISGGLGAIMADHFSAEGFELPTLSPDTQAALRAIPIKFGSTANPVDTTGAIQRDETLIGPILSTVGKDAAVDAVVFPNAARFPQRALELAGLMADAADTMDVPLLSVWYGGMDNDPAMRRLHESARVASFEDPSAAARALAALRMFREHRAHIGARGRRAVAGLEAGARSATPHDMPVEPRGMSVEPRGMSVEPQGMSLALRGVLSEPAGKALLAAHGVPLPLERTATSVDDALAAADVIGFPVAMKIVSAAIPHKAAVGGVALGLRDALDLRRAYATMMDAVALRAPGAPIDGVLVSAMLDVRAELLVGSFVDDTLGPALVVGAGGGDVETLRDVAMRLLPVSRSDCRNLIDEIRDPRIRALDVAHKERLADAVTAIAAMATHLQPALRELDVNPVALTRAGEVFALDAMLVFADAPRDERASTHA